MSENTIDVGTNRPSLGVVIPTLNAAETLARCIGALDEARPRLARRILVVDGGSQDGTPALAGRLGADVMETAPGRGAQLQAGASRSDAEWLLFLHADTVLAPGWSHEAARFIGDAANERRAGAFRFALDDKTAAARRVEAFVSWRCRTLGLAYGDQGLLIRHRFYREIGGFRPLVLMEDVDIMRRIGRARLVMLEAAAMTSAARYKRRGYAARGLRNLFCLSLYFARVPPKFIARVYG